MKKITLLGALVVAGMATAQVVQVAPEQMKLQKMEAQSIEMKAEVSLEEWNGYNKKVAAANYDLVDYYVVEGMMYGGLTAEWKGYPYGFIMTPAYKDIVFENLYGPTTWTIGGQIQQENSVSFELGLMDAGMWTAVPTTTDHMWQYDDTTLLSVKGYLYGSTEQAQYLITGANHLVAADGNIPLTQCAMSCDPLYAESGSDFYIVGAGDLGPYAYGTDLVYQGKSIDTILSVVRNISPMRINQMSMPIYSDGITMDKILPAGAQVKVEIIAADLTEGIIYSDSVYGSTIIDAADCVDLGNGQASLVAKFWEEDPFGGVMEVAVLCPGDFVVQITGFNEGNCDFGFISDYYAPTGSTLYLVNGRYTEFWTSPHNLAISYDAYWPGVMPMMGSEALVAPVEGGVAMDGEYEAIALYSNVYDIDLWNIEVPEWIEFVYDESVLESEGYLILQFTAAALEGAEYRQGVVTIDVDGCVAEVVINQGDVPSGVEDIVTPSFNGKAYNLLGVEVDESYKGIVIKNGQKFIQ